MTGSTLHQAFHVVVLLSFLAANGVAFVGGVAPVLFSDRRDLGVPALRTSILLALGAAVGLVAEWLAHALF
ncbi:MAG: hypothetical protein ACREJP_04570 [Candidatus Methylomirabilales bacterium]